MKIHSLDIKNSYESAFHLIGVHTSLEDFQLAYLLNEHLKTCFHKAPFTLDMETKHGKACFSLYNEVSKESELEWYLIANTYTEEKINPLDAIAMIVETKTYLVPENKNVDYFLKIVGKPTRELIHQTIQAVNQINQIVSSYLIEANTLKSKQFLIF